MNKKYLFLYLMMFLTFSIAQSQPNQEPTTKKERRAKKKAKKQKKAFVVEKESQTEVKSLPSKAPSKQDTTITQEVGANTQSVKSPKNEQATELIIEELIKNSKDFVENKPNGNINWTQQYVEATGQSVIDNERFKNPAQAKLMAARGAVVIAQRNLLEIVKGVNIIGETKVQDMMTTSDYVYTRVEGVVKGAQQIGEAVEKNGFMEVRLKMPLYGNNGLANTFDEPSMRTAKKKNGFETSEMLAQTDETSGQGIDGSKPILFNIENNEPLDPSMFPVILDDNGKVLFDFSKIYNPNKGTFPQYLQLTKDILQAYGNDKGVDLINIVQTGKGQFKIPENSSKNVFWNKVARVAQDVGSVLFKLIL
jgi:hypothetical protein